MMNPAHRLQEKPLKRTLNWLLFAKDGKKLPHKQKSCVKFGGSDLNLIVAKFNRLIK